MKRFKYILASFLMVCAAVIVTAQVKTVKGVVVSAVDGEPLIGAAVTIDGSATHYAITDFDGRFEIKNVPFMLKENGRRKTALAYTMYREVLKTIADKSGAPHAQIKDAGNHTVR